MKSNFETLPLEDGSGVVRMKVREKQASQLIEEQYVDPIGKKRIIALKLRPGVALATVSAVLHRGITARLPRADDSRTVIQVPIQGGAYYEQIHVEAWKDNRRIPAPLARPSFW
jgi:hypothetical protein